MKMNETPKKILQGFSIFFGTISFLFIIAELYFFLPGLIQEDLDFHVFLYMMALFISLIPIAVSYRMLKHFSPNSIRDFWLMISFFLYFVATSLDDKIVCKLNNTILTDNQTEAIVLGVIILSVFQFYRLGKRYLTTWVFTSDNENR